MENKKKSERILADYYEKARKSLIEKMKSEDVEQTNLKTKIATFVIYKLSHSSPGWFKSHFLANISKNENNVNVIKNKKILKVENAFFNDIANYLIQMESEVDYVKNILTPLTEEWDKKDFWKPIIIDAFLLAGIYFTSSLDFNKKTNNIIRQKEIKKNINPPYLSKMLSESSMIV